MASIVTAFRNIQTDNFWGAKILVLALIAFFIFTNQKILKFDVQSSITVWGVFIFFTGNF